MEPTRVQTRHIVCYDLLGDDRRFCCCRSFRAGWRDQGIQTAQTSNEDALVVVHRGRHFYLSGMSILIANVLERPLATSSEGERVWKQGRGKRREAGGSMARTVPSGGPWWTVLHTVPWQVVWSVF